MFLSDHISNDQKVLTTATAAMNPENIKNKLNTDRKYFYLNAYVCNICGGDLSSKSETNGNNVYYKGSQ